MKIKITILTENDIPASALNGIDEEQIKSAWQALLDLISVMPMENNDRATVLSAEFVEEELSKNSTKLDKENGDLQPTCNQLATVAKDTNVLHKDTIGRQDALDAIGKCTDIYVNNLPTMVDKAEVYKALNEVPSAEQIVRCKDCKYCDRGIDEDGNPFLKCLGWVYGGTQEEDFCSHAERRTDEGD